MIAERSFFFTTRAAMPAGRSQPRATCQSCAAHPARSAPHLLAALLVLALMVVPVLRAQTVRWEPGAGQLGFNQVSELALVFENCEPTEPVRVPDVPGLTFGRPSQSTQTSMVNFNFTRRYSLVFPVRPTQRADVNIPAFTVTTDKGAARVPAATYSVGDATVGSSGLALSDIATATVSLPKNTFWAGEVIPISYSVSVIRRYFHSIASAVEWVATPLVLEEWTKPEPSETMVRGERRLTASQSTRGYFKQPGRYTLPGAQQVLNLSVGTSGFGLFSTPSVEQRVIQTEPVDVTIRPLPTPPSDFSGAIGQLALVSRIVPTAPAVGEPVTWTLELTGVGNWPDITSLPEREVSRDFSVVQPKSKRAMKENSLFEGTLTEDVVLVPTKPGRYTLGPVRFTYFDPAAGAYRSITTEVVTVTVGPSTSTPVSTPSGPLQFSLDPQVPPTSARILPEAVPPVPPENLPRDPLPIPARRFAPTPVHHLVIAFVLCVSVVPVLVWLALAALRSRTLDPQRRRREAYVALTRILAEMRTTAAGLARPDLLRGWQQHAATLWEIPHAAPGTTLVQDRISMQARDASTAWATLWTEADRAQHGREGALPADWTLRAEGALRAVKVPGWQLSSLFAPKHLLPFLVVCMLALLPCEVGAAQNPREAYARGEFRAAESGWRTVVKKQATDAAARHNLGLALAQQDRWAEAAAQWTSAFLLNTRDDNARWQLALGLQRSGLAPAELVDFSRAEGRHALARLASPAEWQGVALVAGVLIAVALVLLLLKGYGRIGTWARPAALVTLLLAMLLAATATLALRTYGQLAHPEVALVWRASTLRSVPTEADTQKVTALSPGSLAVVDREFLGWSRLNFTGGQTGWARTADLVMLYR
jgi:hypothetical protein